jgi:tRNA(Ile2) C34 agmatinyltransferase TiaS
MGGADRSETMTTIYTVRPEYLVRDAEQIDVAIAAGEMCPDCGCRETESNGHGEYRCCECDHRWGIDFGMRYGY